MLSLLSLASAEMCWQLEVDMGMAALLEVGCLSLGCLFQSILEVGQVSEMERRDVLHTCACQCKASHASFIPQLQLVIYFKMKLNHYISSIITVFKVILISLPIT